jgi:hypothetical protein
VNPEAHEPRLNPAIVVDDTRLAAAVSEFVLGFLSGDGIAVRLAELPLALVRWGFLEGLSYGSGNRSEGGGE